jgi:hypothetical protein
MDQNMVDLKYSGFERLTIGKFLNETYQVFYYELDLFLSYGFTKCSDVDFTLTYKNEYNFTFPATSESVNGYSIWCYYLPERSKEYQEFVQSIAHLRAVDPIEINPNLNSIKLNLFYQIKTALT